MAGLRCVLFCLIACILPYFQHSIHAADKTWDNGGPNNFWDEDDNWDPDEKPQPADKAIVGGNPEVNTLEIFGELENTGTIDITTGTLQPQGDTTNNGTINVGDGSTILSSLNLGAGSSLAGSGEVVLKNSDNLVGSNAILRGGNTAGLPAVNELGHTIRGEGSFIQHWINNGTIRAEEASGNAIAVLRIDNGSLVNNGELRTSATASIQVTSYTLMQGAGGVFVADTQPIVMTGVNTIIGGELNAAGGGAFDLAQGNGIFTLSGVSVNVPLNNVNNVGNSSIRGDAAGITNNSTITLNGGPGGGVLAQFGFTASGTLDGTGEIFLAGGNSNSAIGIFPSISPQFTQGASHTIRGAGHINSPLINNGTIRAEPQAGGSTLQFNSAQTNNNLIHATSGATLRFPSTGDTTQGASGVISAADGGVVNFVGVEITGGRLETTGSGKMDVINSAITTFDSVTNAGNVNLLPFNTLEIKGSTFTNDGTVTLNSTGGNSFTTVRFLNDILLDGNGEIFLNEPSSSFPANVVPNGNLVTQDSSHTIRGAGQIQGAGTFVNNGRIEGASGANPARIRTRLEGTGTLKDVSLNFDSSGTVHAPGNSVGTVPLEGSYAITHNLVRLEMEIGGLTAGTEHDLLDSTGTVSLNGILDVLAVDLGNAYVPTAGDRFDIIESTSAISGTFASANFPSILGARTVTWLPVDYITDPSKVTLEIATVDFLAGDFDENGMVDGADLAKWEAGFGMSAGASHMDGDADGDFDVDGVDFLAWQRQYGIGVSPLSAVVVTVPEPCSLALFLTGTLPAIRRRVCRSI